MTDECKYSMLPDEQGRECSEHGTIDSACREIADLKAKLAEAEKMAESGSIRRRLQVENVDLQKRVRDLESELAESVACYEVEKKRATEREMEYRQVVMDFGSWRETHGLQTAVIADLQKRLADAEERLRKERTLSDRLASSIDWVRKYPELPVAREMYEALAAYDAARKTTPA